MEEGGRLLVKAATLIIVVIILTIGSCNMHTDYRISKAIQGGSDPVVARNAFENSAGSYERLVYLASRRIPCNEQAKAE